MTVDVWHVRNEPGALRRVLVRYGVDPHAPLATGKHGKPYVPGSPIRFSLSHSRAVALVAVSRSREVGVDVEHIRPRKREEQLARRFFSEQEQRDLATLAGDDRTRAFFTCWARKEAVIKAWGTGVSVGLANFDVSVLPDEPPKLKAVRHPDFDAEDWDLRAVDAGADYAAALSTEVARPGRRRH